MVDLVLVDDDEVTLELTKHVLREADCNVTCFVDERAALEHLRAHTPDVLIVDHRMPRMDGLEMLRTLRGSLPRRVYLCSGATPPDDIVAGAVSCGAELLDKDVLGDRDRLVQLLTG